MGLTKQTVVDALVQFLCTRPLSTDQQDWIHQCQQLWTGRTDGVPSDAEMRACMPSTSSCIDFFVVTHQEDAAKLAARHWSYDRWVRDAAALVAEVFAAAAQLLLVWPATAARHVRAVAGEILAWSRQEEVSCQTRVWRAAVLRISMQESGQTRAWQDILHSSDGTHAAKRLVVLLEALLYVEAAHHDAGATCWHERKCIQ